MATLRQASIVVALLCFPHAQCSPVFGIRRYALVSPTTKRKLEKYSIDWALRFRGGSDGPPLGYGDDRHDDYRDRSRRGDEYSYRSNRGSSGYGYQDDGRSNRDDYYGYQPDNNRDDYYGYPQDDGRDSYYGDDRYSDDRGYGASYSAQKVMKGLPSTIRYGDKRIGFSLLSSGAIIMFLGITLFFNKALLRLGNLLFVAGIPMTIGPGRTAGYFFQPKKSRATACLAFGIFLVMIGKAMLGIALEVFGFLNLFGNMFPVAFAILKQFPIIGTLFGGGGGGRSRRSKKSEGYDDYYDNSGRGRDDDPDKYY